MARRCLITGAGGFAGAHALEHILVNTDWDVIATDSFRHKGKTDRITEVLDNGPSSACACTGACFATGVCPVADRAWHKRVSVVTHDLTAPFSNQAVEQMGEIDYIIAFASESHVDRSITDPVPFVMNNTAVMLSTLELTRQVTPRALVLVSTDEVYGPVEAADCEGHPEWDTIMPSNPYCLLPGTDVITRRGLVPIEEFDPAVHRTVSRSGSTSGTPDGLTRRTWKYVTDKPVLRIRTREGAEEIGCTPEHRFFRRSHDVSRGGGTEEVPAKDLRAGDRICLIRKAPFPADLKPVQAEYARFLGYWIADGSYSDRTNYVRLADQKRDYIDFYREQAKEVFGVAAKSSTGAFGSVYKHGTKDCWYLQFASEAQRKFIDLGDRLNVIEQALNMPETALGEFLAGWLDGDGSIAREGALVKRAEIMSVDPRLRRQLKFLLRRLGIVAVNSELAQKVQVTDSRSLQLLRKHVPSLKWREDDTFRTPQNKPGRAENWMWARVESVTEEQYDGKVYDLEVPAYHNYTAGYFLTHNSASKAAQEALAFSYWRTYGVPLIIVNCMNMIGERQDAEKFVPLVLSKVLKGEEVTIHASDENHIGSRHYLHARNLADGILFLLNSPYKPQQFGKLALEPGDRVPHLADRPDRYNIACPDRIDNLAMAQMIADYAGVPLRYKLEDFHATRPGHDPHYGLSPAKMDALGWTPPVPLDKSLEKTVLWTLANRRWLLTG